MGDARTVRRVAGSTAVITTIMVLAGCGASSKSSSSRHATKSIAAAVAATGTYIHQQTQNAEKQTTLDPNKPQAWANLAKARYIEALADFDESTGTYSLAGKANLAAGDQAWQRYLQLDKHPNGTLASLAAQAYQSSDDYVHEAQALQYVVAANPKFAAEWVNLANAAYLAKDVDLGNLAAAKALSLSPKAQRAALKQQFAEAKTEAGE